MLHPDRFKDLPGPHLVYARALPPAEGMKIVFQRLEDGSWEKASDTWVETARFLTWHGGAALSVPAVERVQAVVLRRVASKGLGDADLDAVVFLLESHAKWSSDGAGLAALTAALSDRALPGHAAFIAAGLTQASTFLRSRAEGWPGPYLDLGAWLLANGSAELRRSERAFLLRDLVIQGWRAKRDWVELALRYGVREGVFENFWPEGTGAGLWPMVELALATGKANDELAIDVMRLAGTRMPEPEPLGSSSDNRHCREAILRGLLGADLPRTQAAALWRAVLSGSLALLADAELESIEALDQALHALLETVHGAPSNATWTAFVAREALRILDAEPFDATKTGASMIALVGLHPGFAESLARALRPRLAPRDDDAARLSLEILDAPSERGISIRLQAALQVLSARSPRAAREDVSETLEQLRQEAETLLHRPWMASVYGVDFAALLGAARHIRLDDLPDEEKVRISGEEMLCNRHDFERVVRGASRGGIERARKLLMLYLVHETIHLSQGIGAKSTVDHLRATGAEHTLLHLDLGADHAAASIARLAFPRWQLADLKGLLGEGGFASDRFHTVAGRNRKALRRIGLRVDYLVRTEHPDLARDLGDGYAWADFGPAGGWFLLLGAGPPSRVLGAAKLSSEDAKLLALAADKTMQRADGLHAIDECLRRLLRGLARPGEVSPASA